MSNNFEKRSTVHNRSFFYNNCKTLFFLLAWLILSSWASAQCVDDAIIRINNTDDLSLIGSTDPIEICDNLDPLEVSVQFLDNVDDPINVIATIDWGDGTVQSVSGINSLSHEYAENTPSDEEHVLSITITEAGGSTCATQTITREIVINRSSLAVGEPINFVDGIACFDAVTETFTAQMNLVASSISVNGEIEVNWGDGTTPDIYTEGALQAAAGTLPISHTYVGLIPTSNFTISITPINNFLTTGCVSAVDELSLSFQSEINAAFNLDADVCENGGTISISRTTSFLSLGDEGDFKWKIENTSTPNVLFETDFDGTAIVPNATLVGDLENFDLTLLDSEITAGENVSITLTERNVCGVSTSNESINIISLPDASFSSFNGTAITDPTEILQICIEDLQFDLANTGTYSQGWQLQNGHGIAIAPSVGYTDITSLPFTIPASQVTPGLRTLFIRSIETEDGVSCESFTKLELNIREELEPSFNIIGNFAYNCGRFDFDLENITVNMQDGDIITFERARNTNFTNGLRTLATLTHPTTTATSLSLLGPDNNSNDRDWFIRAIIETPEGCSYTSSIQSFTIRKQPDITKINILTVNGEDPRSSPGSGTRIRLRDYTFCDGDEVVVSVAGRNDNDSDFTWSGQAIPSTDPEPDDSQFTFTISLADDGNDLTVVEDLNGCVDTFSEEMSVEAVPGTVSISVLETNGDGDNDDGAFCEDIGTSSVTLTAVPSNAGSWQYQWLKDGVELSGETNSTLTLEGQSQSGIYDVAVTTSASTSGCEVSSSNTVDVSIAVSPTEVPVITSNCVGDGDIILSITNTPPGLGQRWYRNTINNFAGATQIETAATISISNNIASANYYFVEFTASAGAIRCEGPASTGFLVEVFDAPTIGASNTAVCFGETITLTAAPTGGETEFRWYSTDDLVNPLEDAFSNPITSNTLDISDLGLNQEFVIRAILPDGCFGPTSDPITVDINALPAEATISASSGITTICDDGSSSITLVATTSEGGVEFEWFETSDPSTILETSSSLILDDPSRTGSYSVRTKVIATGCLSATTPAAIAVDIRTPPTPPAVEVTSGITDAFCDDGINSVTLQSSVEADSYQWFLDGTPIAGQNLRTITISEASASGNYAVSIIDNDPVICESAPSDPRLVEIVSLPTTPTISVSGAGIEFCAEGGNSVILTASTVGAGESYRWYRDLNQNGSFDPIPDAEGGNLAAIELDQVSQSGDYYVEVVGSSPTNCVSIPSGVETIRIKPIPNEPNVAGSENFCQGDEENIFVVDPPIDGATYNWVIPTGVVLTSGGGNNSFVRLDFPTTGTYPLQLSVTVDGCESPVHEKILNVLNPVNTSPIAGQTEVCEDEMGITYSVTNTTLSSYEWTVPGGAFITSGQGTNEITVQFGSAAAAAANPIIQVIETNTAGCASAPVQETITVNANPSASISGTFDICEGQSFDIPITWSGSLPLQVSYLVDGVPTSVEIPTGSSSPFNLEVTPTTTTIYTLDGVEDDNACLGITSGLVRINVSDAPMLELGDNRAIPQGGNTGPIIPVILEGTFSTIAWTADPPTAGSFDNASIENPTFTPNSGFTGSVTIEAVIDDPGPCPFVDDNFILNVQPAGTIIAGNEIIACEDEANISFADASRDGANEYDEYTWSSSRPGVFSSTTVNSPASDDALDVTFMPTDGLGNYIITLTAKDLVGTTNRPEATANFILKITALPNIITMGSAIVVPLGSSDIPLNPNVDDASTYDWSDNGAGGSFSDATIINPTYTPAGDGEFTLTLTVGDGSGSCPNVADDLQVVVYDVRAGDDELVCSDQGTVLLEANVSDLFESITWMAPSGSSGTLSSDPSDPTNPRKAQYTLGSGESGSLTFTIEATDTDGIAGTITDSKVITINETIEVATLSNQNILQGSSLPLTGAASGSFSSVLWEIFEADGVTTAPGTFAPDNNLITTFNPATSQVGTFVVRLTASAGAGNPCPADSKEFTLTITPTSDTDLDAGTDQSVCEGDAIVLDATVGTAYNTITWTTTATGSGTFNNNNLEDPTYTPGTGETGTITFTIEVQDTDGPAPTRTDQVTVTINETIEVATLSDQNILQGSSLPLTGAASGSFSSVLWEIFEADGVTTAPGTFAPDNNLITTFNPATSQVGTFVVRLTASAGAGNPCPADSKEFTLTITPTSDTDLDAGTDQSVCEGDAIVLDATVGTAYNTITWTTTATGSGTFNNNNLEDPTYTPGTGETGTITFTIEVQDTDGPAPTRTDQVNITINQEPSIDGLPDQSLPINTSVFLSPTVSGFYTISTWTANAASGTENGIFSNPTQLSTNYLPPLDYVGAVTVTLTLSDGAGPCEDVSTSFELTFNSAGAITLNGAQTICEGDDVALTAVVSPDPSETPGYESYLWSANRPGTFDDNTSLTPTFTPTDGTGNYIITMEASDLDESSLPPVRSFTQVTVNPLPTVEFISIDDQTICEGQSAELSVRLTGTTINGPWRITYTDGTTTFTESDIISSTHSFNVPGEVDETTTYQLLSVSENNSVTCNGEVNNLLDAVNVIKRSLPTASLTVLDTEICEGDVTALQFSFTGDGPWNIEWSDDGGITNNPVNGITNPVFTIPIAPSVGITEYSLTALSEENGVLCDGIISGVNALVTVIEAPTAALSGSTSICEGETANLLFNFTGTTGPWTVVFNDGTNDITLTDITTPTFEHPVSPAVTTTYTFVSVAEGTTIQCVGSGSGTATVEVFDNPQVSPVINSEFCSGESVEVLGNALVGSGNIVSHLWTGSGALFLDDVNTPNPEFRTIVSTAQTFELIYTVFDENGCTAVSDPISFTVNPTPEVDVVLSSEETCSNADITISGNASGGTGAYTHLWTGPGAAFLSNATIENPVFSTSVSFETVYELVYTVTDEKNCTASQTVSVTVFPALEVTPITDQVVCEGETIFMETEITGKFTDINWSSTVAGTFSSPNQSSTFFIPDDGVFGLASFTVLVTDADGLCDAESATFEATIREGITVDAGISQSLCQGDEAPLNGTVTGFFNEISWSTTGSGTILNPESLNATYQPQPDETGIVSFILEVRDSNGICPATSDVVTINYNRQVTIDLAAPNQSCQGTVVPIEGMVVGTFDQLEWVSSGSGSFSNSASPVTNYIPGNGEVGNVELTLTAIDNTGICEDVSESIIVEILEEPTIDVGPDIEINEGDIVTLSADVSGTFTSLTWSSIGSGTFSSPNATNTTYTPADGEEGVVTLSLIAKDEGGVCNDASDLLILTIVPAPPVSIFETDVTSGCAPLTVNFSNLSMEAEPDGYIWNFGDGSNEIRIENTSYTFQEPGNYTVTLTATNSFGVTSTSSTEITVFAEPLASFFVDPVTYFTPDPVIITNNSRRTVSYLWDFGDGSTSTEFEPLHVYTETGNYQITLTATSEDGCTNEFVFGSPITVLQGGTIEVPNAFTPSILGPADGRIVDPRSNDVFLPVLEGVSEFQMNIYNRNGAQVFESSDPEVGWNGFLNGKLAPSGVYTYNLRVRFGDGQVTNKSGIVQLIR